jgi:sugar transferase (PEP-CTERM/EpsH1 system associated)
MMSELLFLAHRIPYPPNKGDKIRSWNILKFLTQHYRVHLGCFIDDPEDEKHRPTLEAICESCQFTRLNPSLAKLRSLSGILSGAPLTLPYFWDRQLAKWTETVLRDRKIEHVFVFSSSMAQYAIGEAAARACRVVDYVDVDSDKWRQYAAAKSGPAAWIYGRESRRLLSFEREVAAASDASLFVSEAEADLFRGLAPESAGKIGALNNGVDFEFFDPTLSYERPFDGPEPALVFTGAMDYWANVDAVTWFAKDVFPGIRAKCPTAGFWIVGSRPSPQVTELSTLPGVHVTGSVSDIRPYIAHAHIVVAPLRLARGIQNKVLEAMAMARPVIASPEALEGIAAENGRDIICADGAGAFIEHAVDLLGQSRADDMGKCARERVVSAYGWSSNLAGLKTLLENGPVV